MEESINKSVLEPGSKSPDVSQFSKLNKGLLYLLTGELSYFVIVVILLALTLLPGVSSGGRDSDFSAIFRNFFPWGYLPFLIGYIGNLLGAIASLILTIKSGKEDLPGIGHLLNWFLIISTCWILIFVLTMMSPVSRGFD